VLANPAILQLVLGLLALYHLGIGLLSVLSQRWTAKVTRGLYDITLDENPQFHYAVKMLGLYALTLGFLLSLAAFNPVEHRAVILAVILLQSMRALFRWFYNPLVTTAFQVGTSRNLLHVGILLAEVAVLVIWYPWGPR
jgi:hypothetical protein